MSRVGLAVGGVVGCTTRGAGAGTGLGGVRVGERERVVGDFVASDGMEVGGASDMKVEGGAGAGVDCWAAGTGVDATGGGANENEGVADRGGVGRGVGAKVTFLSNQLDCLVTSGVETEANAGAGIEAAGARGDLPREEVNAEPEVEGVELILGLLNAGAGLKACTGAAALDDRLVDDADTPCFPLTISTSDRPSRLAVIDFHRRVYGAS